MTVLSETATATFFELFKKFLTTEGKAGVQKGVINRASSFQLFTRHCLLKRKRILASRVFGGRAFIRWVTAVAVSFAFQFAAVLWYVYLNLSLRTDLPLFLAQGSSSQNGKVQLHCSSETHCSGKTWTSRLRDQVRFFKAKPFSILCFCLLLWPVVGFTCWLLRNFPGVISLPWYFVQEKVNWKPHWLPLYIHCRVTARA